MRHRDVPDAAAEILRLRHPEAWVEEFAHLARHPSWACSLAIQVLGRMQTPAALEALLALADELGRGAARFSAHRGADVLLAALQQETDPPAQAAVASLLGTPRPSTNPRPPMPHPGTGPSTVGPTPRRPSQPNGRY